ncbi:hypothetical protein PQ465_05985 [Sphingobacterium oryzagri]|uniref:FAD:protein FMN transferase n=1 Tax=Sphingobacterium oryzagri TaxID=3025669 RepID=A0ABY7WN09_9SPHI|nr:hypothetical protein [Sphingobacterium sp. KACC 22765]WDF69924.1 hypothetical protein PQ465_05985 [Sphingobacterium sp. KACC 22765]
MKKTYILLFALFALNLSCKEEKIAPTVISYIGALSIEYITTTGILGLKTEKEQIEAATRTLETIFHANDIETWQHMEMRKIFDETFWFTVYLTEQEFLKLQHENRVSIGPNSFVGI